MLQYNFGSSAIFKYDTFESYKNFFIYNWLLSQDSLSILIGKNDNSVGIIITLRRYLKLIQLGIYQNGILIRVLLDSHDLEVKQTDGIENPLVTDWNSDLVRLRAKYLNTFMRATNIFRHYYSFVRVHYRVGGYEIKNFPACETLLRCSKLCNCRLIKIEFVSSEILTTEIFFFTIKINDACKFYLMINSCIDNV